MKKCIRFLPFMKAVFDQDKQAEQAAEIGVALLESRCPRISDLAAKMRGNPAANYKAIQRFLIQADPRYALQRLYREAAEFVIGDPTEMPRPEAYKTPYVGKLKDGETRGYWLLVLSTPYRGRALPFAELTYSSSTIRHQVTSRNQYHFQTFAQIKTLLGEKPLVLDREFSYAELLASLVFEKLHFVIRLKLGSHAPTFLDAEGQPIRLLISKGERRILPNVFYKGQVCVNLAGVWNEGFADPLWVMTDLDPQKALQIYFNRMKIDETFRDLKSLLGMDRLMHKRQDYLEKMLALVLLTYTIAFLLGEKVRDHLYGDGSENPYLQAQPSRKYRSYSGLFILLKQKFNLSRSVWRSLTSQVLQDFLSFVQPVVRSPV
jgi:hypothetical protein